MQRSPIDRWLDRSGGGGKGAHNRETLPTTGRTTRIVIVPREFAPISHTPAGLLIPTAIRMRFLRHDGIYRSDVSFLLFTPGACPAFRSGRCQGIGHAGKNMTCPSSAMSSGRLFLDRVGRHQSPSPLHRHGQHNLIARPEGTNYHRTVNSVLTVCVSSGGRRKARPGHQL